MKRRALTAIGLILLILAPAAASASPFPEYEGTTRLVFARYFENYKGSFLTVRAYDPEAPNQITATWTEDGEQMSGQIDRVADSGAYLWHRKTFPVSSRPEFVTVTRDEDNWSRIEVEDWVTPPPSHSENYEQGFHDHYPNAVEINQRMQDLAEAFPSLAEIIEMPYETAGYRRQAQVTLGNGASGTWDELPAAARGRAIVITSNAFGHNGGNSIKVALNDPGEPNSPLSVSAAGNTVQVNLGTDGSGNISSTAANVVAAINGSSEASELVRAMTYRGNAGGNIPIPTEGEVQLTDNLSAPGSVPRGPQKVRVLRIGAHRDGSRTGVLVAGGLAGRTRASQLTVIEFAEQLLRNYGNDAEIKMLVDDLDIFVVPVVNPDGDLYSHFDSTLHQKNIPPTCIGNNPTDPSGRHTWGVNINRNFPVGSLFDGYSGASNSCSSEEYVGSFEISEPETKNMVWLAQNFSNIKFSAEVASHGGQIGFPPGSYVSAGRVLLPAPPVEKLQFFQQMAERMAARTARWRQNVILPDTVGIRTDVMQESAAGNLSDFLYYDRGIFSQLVQVGIPRHSSGTTWQEVGFTPDFDTEGKPSSIEFADGLIGMLETAREWSQDSTPPEVTVQPAPGAYGPSVEVRFESNEPARIHYTLDGSEPDENSPVWQPENLQEGLTYPIELTETTTVRWFAVDAKGNRSETESATYVVPDAQFALTPSADRLDFGSLEKGAASQSLTVQVESGGWGATQIEEVVIEGDDSFAVGDEDCRSAALHYGESCMIQVSFSPASAGPKQATMLVKAEGGAATATVDLEATVFEPETPQLPVDPGKPSPPADPGMVPGRLLRSAKADTRCIGNPRLARTKRDLRVRLVLAGSSRVTVKLQRRFPLQPQPAKCPRRPILPKKPPKFGNSVPVRTGKGKTALKRFSTHLDLTQGSHRIPVLRTLGVRRLATGHYRLWIVARDDKGRAAGKVAIHFRVLRR